MHMQQTVRPVFLRPNAAPGASQPQHAAPASVRSTPAGPGGPTAGPTFLPVPTPTTQGFNGSAAVVPQRQCSKGPGSLMPEKMALLQSPGAHLERSPSRRPTVSNEPEILCTPGARTPRTRSSGLEALEDEVKELRQRMAEELPRLWQENATLKAGGAAKVDALERSLAEEVEARSELERGLGKDLREFVKSEMEHAREMMMREMRERMDGQKVLREEVHLQQQALASFTGKMDEAIIELRTELPRLGQESAAMKAELEKITEQHTCLASRMEALERGLAEESQERCAGLRSLGKEFHEHLAHQMQSSNTQLTELRKQLDELILRTEASNTALGKEFRDHVAVETERVTTQMAELKKLHNELRLRADVSQNLLSKDLRDHIALEVERLTAQLAELRRLTDEQGSRADEAHKALNKDLREHVALESKDLRDHLVLEREQKEKEVAELRRLNNELGSRIDAALGAQSKDLREYVALEAERVAAQFAELKRLLDELGARTGATQGAVQSVHEHADHLAHELAEARTGVGRLEEQIAAWQNQSAQQASELEKRLSETDTALRSCVDVAVGEANTGLRSWVETAVLNRVNSLDRGLRTEMAERSSAIQQVVGKVSHNAERWCQLQAKFDEILVEMSRASKSTTRPGAGTGS